MKILYSLLFVFCFYNLFSQIHISGVVIDSTGKGIPNVMVFESDFKNGTVTDSNGKFFLTSLKDTAIINVTSFLNSKKTMKACSDTDFLVVLKYIPYQSDYIYQRQTWRTISAQYDFMNSIICLSLSNGFDERPLIHFEDFHEKFHFKVQGGTDFKDNYAIGVDVGVKLPEWYISVVGMEFKQVENLSKKYFIRELNISSEANLDRYGLAFKIKAAYQTLNEYNNFGVGLEIRKVLWYSKIYGGISSDYFGRYFNYSGYVQGFVYKKKIGLRLKYERIKTFDFLHLGLNYTFPD